MDKRSGRLVNGHPATQSLKAEFRALIPDLPDGWKKRFYEEDPSMDSASGANRLTKIRQGTVAPTTGELATLKKIIAREKDKQPGASSTVLVKS